MLAVLLSLLFLSIGISASSLKFLTSNGTQRSYWAHVPSTYERSKSYPVVIAFHGSSKLGFDIDGFAMEADTRLSLPLVPTKYSESVCQISLGTALTVLIERRGSLYTQTALEERGRVLLMQRPLFLRTFSSLTIFSSI